MILFIDNYDSFTWNLVQRLGELDPTLEPDRDLLVVRNDKISAEDAEKIDQGRGPSHVIISPGPCTPNEAGVSSEIIRRFQGRVPVLGVCLGHQCLAASNGMTVTRHVIPMHGKTSPIHHDNRGIFAGLPNPFDATRYHSLVVLPETIPSSKDAAGERWEISAWAIEHDEHGHERRVVMGLRRVFSDSTRFPVEGVQFHPESFLTRHGPRLLANFLKTGSRPRRVVSDRIERLIGAAV
jgi:anthranilate synthase/aminodeoxychorismate synthase-like glutamine amidotransferase